MNRSEIIRRACSEARRHFRNPKIVEETVRRDPQIVEEMVEASLAMATPEQLSGLRNELSNAIAAIVREVYMHNGPLLAVGRSRPVEMARKVDFETRCGMIKMMRLKSLDDQKKKHLS